MAENQMQADVQRITTRDFLGISKVLTLVENHPESFWDLWPALCGRLGQAVTVGVTGWPGVGKSTLMGRLLEHVTDEDGYVGVLAVDPTSHLTGGAVLGDRLRMMSTVLKTNVFVRSLASRGDQSGMTASTLSAADVMDAAGFSWIFIETVGVGQTQVDILELADIVVLVTAPGLGDEIQAIKAGILEIPDLIVVNMADRPGSHRTIAGLRWALGHEARNRGRILSTVALDDVGVGQLWEQLKVLGAERDSSDRHHRHQWRNRRRSVMFAKQRWTQLLDSTIRDAQFQTLLKEVELGQRDPREAGMALLAGAQKMLASQELIRRAAP